MARSGVVQIRVTPKRRNPFTVRALSISGVTWKWDLLNHAQVADRFHLLQNLAEALEVVFSSHATDLHSAERARRDAVLAEHGTVFYRAVRAAGESKASGGRAPGAALGPA